MKTAETIKRFLNEFISKFLNGLELVFGSEAQPGLLSFLFLAPFMGLAWVYQEFKWRFFKPNPMVFYAQMIEAIDSREWFIRVMKLKGWTNEEEQAYRKTCKRWSEEP